MYDGKDELLIIQEDVKRVLKRPGARWAMLIDLRRCVLCHSCTVACINEQKSPPGIAYRPVYEEELGTYPKVKRRFTPRPCQQCDNPSCVAACPNAGENGATWKSAQGDSAGIVMINYEQCIGCGRCVVACPYKVRALDKGAFYTENTPKIEDYEKAPTFEYSRKWPREASHLPVGVARKCHFCLHRLRKGMIPICVSTCIGRVNYFGDPTDPESLIYKVMRENRISVLVRTRTPGETKPTFAQLEGMEPEEISAKIGYPGKTPVFGESATTQPRVYYILP
ncbi:4Fe-4S dicluster domain-containing protein [Candidatus Saganbacteria bacterium]|uniref:4Fe-4S dicluster domain-containing protein n=1 Tax=Candidatus Saganbacteria bacterium TaxID=2575572 RepID=A0A9D6YT95_UNCSA|nr:4Fe-4S dicluster domain-containing protein [Candidatus Saganbacteria bacterium]